MNRSITRATRCLAIATLFFALSARADLKHRYSFGDAAGSATAKDSAGTADGTLHGGATLNGNGTLTLDGTDGYVDLPNGIISQLTDATFEAWVTFSGQGGAWQRVFDFGSNSNGEDQQGTGTSYLFLTPRTGTGGPTRFAATMDSSGTPRENPILDAPTMDAGVETHVAVTYNFTDKVARLFVNGKLIASGTATVALKDVQDINNWLGRSNWPDAFFEGDFNEFRIYDTALSPLQIALDALAGPDQVGGGDPGALQTLSLTVEAGMIKNDTQQAVVGATFAKVSDVDVSSDAETTYTSSAPSVIKVSATGSIQATGVGTAAITASYRGKQDTKVITVGPLPGLAPILQHRYSFNGASTGTTAPDSVGTANGTLMGGAALTGDGSVELNGTDAFVDLPNGIISSLTNATFEAWVTWNGNSVWQRIFDFGSNSAGEDRQGTGQTYLFLSPRNGANNTVRFAATSSSSGGERPILNGRAAITIGKPTYVAVTYNVTEKLGKMYVDGQLVSTGAVSVALKSIRDVNNWLGRSNWPDPFFNGRISEFRIYEGILSDQEVAFSTAAGPDTIGRDPGTFKSVGVDAPTQPLILGGLPVNGAVLATFQNVTNVNVTTFEGAKIESSNPKVVAVTTNGVIDAVAVGTATIKASYQGKEATANVTVTAPPDAPPKPKLAHRYSFNDPVGSTTVKDTVGASDGTLFGGGTFTGDGRLTLNGSNSYVDLPNGTVSSLNNATFETWVTWTGTRTWERIFDFGSNTAGEDAQGTGQTYLFLTPRGGPGNVRFAVTTNSGVGESPVLDGAAPLARNQLAHVVVSYNSSGGSVRLYVNGQRVAVGPASITLPSIEDVNVWLGRSNYNDPYFTGSFSEFRIYNGALLDPDVAASFAAGPDALPGDVPQQPTISAVFSSGSLVISWPATATGFVLESSAALGSQSAWAAVTDKAVTENGAIKVTITPAPGARFFRLKR